MAIDDGVASQAQRAQGDPIQNYVKLKLNKHRRVIEHEFRNEGISVRAVVWSQEGRPGRDAREVVDGLAKHTEKYVPGATKSTARQRLQHEFATQLQMCNDKMIRACVPPSTGHQAGLRLELHDNTPTQTMNDL